MDDTKNFMKDIGLDYYAKKLKEAYVPVPSNLKPFFSPHSMKMDDPRAACQVHIINMIKTYGIDAVTESVAAILENL